MDKKAKKVALPEEEWCEICFIKFTPKSMMQRHQNSVSHKKKINKYEAVCSEGIRLRDLYKFLDRIVFYIISDFKN